ncbi:MAG: Hsp20/alpha crystallin family protein [Nitrospinae bacterium]|nr:Hsp20/alpha crystallin family protein [Nitrospinota bacterium]
MTLPNDPGTVLGHWLDPDVFLNSALAHLDFCPDERHNVPRVNIFEKPGEFTLVAEVPGYKDGEIQISAENGMLRMKGGRKPVGPDSDGVCRAREFEQMNFERSFRLGDTLDAEKISAKLESGLLTLTLPKKEEAKPRRIDIKIQS